MSVTLSPQMKNDYAARIAAIHQALGIPRNYITRGLPLCEEATELTNIGPDIHQRMRQLRPDAACAWHAMRQNAERDGVTLLVVSAFRSADYQRELIAAKLSRNELLDNILQVMAAPGYSEHHTGRALDLTAPDIEPLDEAFERSTAFAWLQQNAAHSGFYLSYPRDNPHGIMYEPWHWAFSGTTT